MKFFFLSRWPKIHNIRRHFSITRQRIPLNERPLISWKENNFQRLKWRRRWYCCIPESCRIESWRKEEGRKEIPASSQLESIVTRVINDQSRDSVSNLVSVRKIFIYDKNSRRLAKSIVIANGWNWVFCPKKFRTKS